MTHKMILRVNKNIRLVVVRSRHTWTVKIRGVKYWEFIAHGDTRKMAIQRAYDRVAEGMAKAADRMTDMGAIARRLYKEVKR